MKSSVGSRIVGRLKSFTEALEGGEVIPKRFTCHTVTLDLQPARYVPELVRKTRNSLGVSQTLFAQFLGVSPSTVRAWEQGTHKPNDVASRFMDEIRENPEYWRARIRKAARRKLIKSA